MSGDKNTDSHNRLVVGSNPAEPTFRGHSKKILFSSKRAAQ